MPTLLVGQSSRIVYEGARALRSGTEGERIQPLMDLLPADGSIILTNARHATKLTEGIRAPASPLHRQLQALLEGHRRFMFGRAPWPLRRILPELGVQTLGDHLLAVSVALQFEFGVPSTVPPSELGTTLHEVMAQQGATIAVLAAVDLAVEAHGDPSEPSGALDLTGLAGWRIDDWRMARLAARYGPHPTEAAALVIAMIEGRVNTVLHVLAVAEAEYPGPVFRARFLALMDVIRTMQTLAGDRSAPVRLTRAMHLLLAEEKVQRLLYAPEPRRLRNVLMHYGFGSTDLSLDTDAPLLGLVDALDPSRGFENHEAETRALLLAIADHALSA